MSSHHGPVDRFKRAGELEQARRAQERADKAAEWKEGDQAVKRTFQVFDHPSGTKLRCRLCGREMVTGQWAASIVVDGKGTREYQHSSGEDCDMDLLTISQRRRARNLMRVAMRKLEAGADVSEPVP